MEVEDIQSTVAETVRSVLRFQPDAIGVTTDLRDIPGVESIKILRIVASLERQFGIRLDDHWYFA